MDLSIIYLIPNSFAHIITGIATMEDVISYFKHTNKPFIPQCAIEKQTKEWLKNDAYMVIRLISSRYKYPANKSTIEAHLYSFIEGVNKVYIEEILNEASRQGVNEVVNGVLSDDKNTINRTLSRMRKSADKLEIRTMTFLIPALNNEMCIKVSELLLNELRISMEDRKRLAEILIILHNEGATLNDGIINFLRYSSYLR